MKRPCTNLENHVLPKEVPEHLLKEADHGAQRRRHPVVLLLERDDEGVDELDAILERVDEAVDSLLLLREFVAKAGGVDDGEGFPRRIYEPSSSVCAGPLRHGAATVEAQDLKK